MGYIDWLEEKEENIKSNHVLLYHGTSVKNIKNIIKEGQLVPQGGTGAKPMELLWGDYDEKDYYGYLFFSDLYYRAMDYSILSGDHCWDETYSNILIVLALEIHEDKLLPDLHDAKDTGTWQESLEACNQVCVKGSINREDISYLLFVDMENGEIVGIANTDDWEAPFMNVVKNKKLK